ncbi:MAG: hypothetical protein BGP06_19255 [Rhizobiales bacterium 65-9]|nr:MAG: hypothetical protein BGP06_19255 [Rhizobiales bacterium 65-9]
MRYYVALIHRDPDSAYGVTFPDVPGAIATADDLEEAIAQSREILTFAAEKWFAVTGDPFPAPRPIEELCLDGGFAEAARTALLILIPVPDTAH